MRSRRDYQVRYCFTYRIAGKPQYAEVVAVGPGTVVDGEKIEMQVKVGDKVIYSRYAGNDVELDGDKFIIVKQNDIHAVVEA